jgi:hypothetical protein
MWFENCRRNDSKNKSKFQYCRWCLPSAFGLTAQKWKKKSGFDEQKKKGFWSTKLVLVDNFFFSAQSL